MMLPETIKGSKYADATVLATIDNWFGGNRNIKYKAEFDWFQEKMITKKMQNHIGILTWIYQYSTADLSMGCLTKWNANSASTK